jgi:hypothetical protein
MKATYRGPGDSVIVDGIECKKGEAVELTSSQLERAAAGGNEFDVDEAKKPARASVAKEV